MKKNCNREQSKTVWNNGTILCDCLSENLRICLCWYEDSSLPFPNIYRNFINETGQLVIKLKRLSLPQTSVWVIYQQVRSEQGKDEVFGLLKRPKVRLGEI